METKRIGMTLVEVILAIALLGMISVSLITVFSTQLMNINRGTDITVKAMDAQSVFENLIYDVKIKIQNNETPSASTPEWTNETVSIMGKDVVMQKLTKNYANDAKENTVFLSKRLAEVEKINRIPISGVMIEVSNDPNNLVADLSSSPLPNLKAVHDNNSNETGFYVNLYRWWKSTPGKDISHLTFPEDFSIVNVTQTTDVLTNLLDNVGSGRYVALTVTPVDIHGFRGNTLVSSNYVFIKGAEWRIGLFPWADMNNDYNLDGNDVQIATDRIKIILDAKNHLIPYYLDTNQMLSIKNSSLFVPMNIEPGGGQMPGTIPAEISGANVIDWSFENNINLAKNMEVLNGSNVNITAGTGGNSGSIYLYPYIELNAAGNPIFINGAPKIINYGATIKTTGDISFKTLSRGNIELLNHNQLKGNNIGLEARGSIIINNSSLIADNDIIFNTTKDLGITGGRLIRLDSTLLSSFSPNSKIKFDTTTDVIFKGGGWSSNQTMYIPDGKNLLFIKGATKVSNAGTIDVGNTGRIFFQNSMDQDLARSLRIRLEKKSNDSFLLTTLNYNRSVNYASSSNNQKVIASGLWTKLGTGNHNYEFAARVVSGPGVLDDLAYSYNGNGGIKIGVTITQQRQNTRVKFDVRDRFNTEIVGFGFFNYSVSNTGVPTIDVEEPPLLDYYTITFNTNGGSEIAPIEGYVGENVGTVPIPTRVGYEFLGWDKPVPTVIPDYDLELTAIWRAIEYNITFDSNGGPAISTKHYKYGEQISISDPIRNGYAFAGWNPMPPATMPANDLHLVAQWTQSNIIVSFDSNDNTVPNPSSRQVFFDSPYGALPVVSRNGYKFIGWYTERTYVNLVTSTTKVTNSNNHTLYARWEAATVKVERVLLLDTDGQYKQQIFKEVVRNYSERIQLQIKIEPENANNKNVTWQSNNTSIATVDSSGRVTIVRGATGRVVITVTTEDGGKTATLTLNVTNSGC